MSSREVWRYVSSFFEADIGSDARKEAMVELVVMFVLVGEAVYVVDPDGSNIAGRSEVCGWQSGCVCWGWYWHYVSQGRWEIRWEEETIVGM